MVLLEILRIVDSIVFSSVRSWKKYVGEVYASQYLELISKKGCIQ